jgi:peroxiredoxin Q/BCP
MRRAFVPLVLALAASAFAEAKVGEPAPDFTLKDQDGKDVKLSDYKGKQHVLLAFYPKDGSNGCTNEMKTFVASWKKLRARDVMILAISGDPVESHCKFAAELGVQFRLLSDPGLATAKTYDVVSEQPSGAVAARSAFLVDKEGRLRWLERDLKVPVKTLDGTDILAAIEKVAVKTDPLASLAELPPAERDGKTIFVRYAQAMLAEDAQALDALLDPEACGKPGESPQMQRDRRKLLVDKWRATFDKNDLRTLKFDDVVDVRGSRVLDKAAAAPESLAGFGSDVRAVAARLGEGELLVVGRTTSPKLGETQVFAREVVLRLRKTGDAWKILEVAP